MSGFDVNQLADHLICGMCLNILNDAINSRCRHSFCRQCMQRWIESNHKKCPECNQGFTTKRSIDGRDGSLVLIGNYVFSYDLKINGIISELKIKCSFAYNGCQKILKFGSLESHLKLCDHRLCKTCGLAGDPEGPHNCVEVLKNANNDLKLKHEKCEQELKEFHRLLEPESQIHLKVKTLLIGCYETDVKDIMMCCLGIQLNAILPSNHILFHYKEIVEVIYCSDLSFPVLIIRINANSCREIQKSLCLGSGSRNGLKFDVNSNDKRLKYIQLVLKNKRLYEKCISTLVNHSTQSQSNTKFVSKDLSTTRLMVRRAKSLAKSLNP